MSSILNIVLLCGGASPERPVSKLSSKSIYEFLELLGHSVTIIDPALGKKQFTDPNDYFIEDLDFDISHKNYIDALSLPVFDNTDLVFIGLHGKWGEDGTLQSILELKGLKYTGSGILASALAMDKGKSKAIFHQYGISVHPGFVIQKNRFEFEEILKRVKKDLSFPAVVKPNDQGSTFGLTICQNESLFPEALEFAFTFSDYVIIEKFVPGRELTVGVLDNKALPVLEIIPKHELYDYECKYTKGMSEYVVPAQIPSDLFSLLQNQALLAYNSLGCKDYARVDFKLTPSGEVFCFEVNTLPGMTSTSLLPKMAAAIDISFENLIELIINKSLNGG